MYAIVSSSSNTSSAFERQYIPVGRQYFSFYTTLNAGQNYYFIATACGYMTNGFYYAFSYSVNISGTGSTIIGGDVANDTDVDGIANNDDNCPSNANQNQQDTDGDDIGDVCDSTPNGDRDSDGVDNLSDNCPDTANSNQLDTDGDNIGDVCDPYPNDADGDTTDDSVDNCPDTANTNQLDTDGDTIGDACDSTPSGDNDSDGVENALDNCVNAYNPAQEDVDGDTIGDACDTTPSGDDDADGVDNAVDNCPTDANAGQADNDGDGIGNRCDSTAHIDSDNDGIADRDDECPLYGDGGFGIEENGCPPNIVLPPDDRVNWQYGDLNVVIYRHEDGVAVYCYNGNAWLGMHVNQALVDSWDSSQPQDVPVLEVDHAGCRTAFYILDSGEYQINIWTFEGKLYEIIADNLHFDNATMRYFDPNE